ncbi:MAG: DEAD/DEAH box helicase [Methylococcaceae bacterium]|nr:DEAD/DEAH box helicase [Methylococcaceae bacterium]MCI0667225.1 DEAD/DEAH box helicase [Methylococcaceae bacterium]
MNHNVLTETTFNSFDLPEPLLEGLRFANFTYCTPIQQVALPLVLQGLDLAGQAQTGTGKTAAFLVALFKTLLTHPGTQDRKHPRALVIAPTRELAIQIANDARQLGQFTGFKISLVYGGTDYRQQLAEVSDGADILIGTPGRLIDFYKQKLFRLDRIEVVVLDEADRMFDLGFIKDIRFLLRRMPKPDKRQSLLFSATLSYRVLELAYEHMNNPQLVRIEPERVTARSVLQLAFYPSNEQKSSLLIGLLREKNPERCMIFVNTKKAAEQLKLCLSANGFNPGVLSGDVPQKKRQNLLRQFQGEGLRILIATDVAARGLHIPDVTHVFNFDLPQDVEDYVHRIGRTARLGNSGEAISLVCEEYVYSLPEIEDFVGHKLPMTPLRADLLPEIQKPRKHHSGHAPKKKPVSGKNHGNSNMNGRPRRRKGSKKTAKPNTQIIRTDTTSQ